MRRSLYPMPVNIQYVEVFTNFLYRKCILENRAEFQDDDDDDDDDDFSRTTVS